MESKFMRYNILMVRDMQRSEAYTPETEKGSKPECPKFQTSFLTNLVRHPSTHRLLTTPRLTSYLRLAVNGRMIVLVNKSTDRSG